ncbi:Os03g0432200 [Oryza sativa Japonica Group]|uniref:Os03g0432200 protein n=1 Tax=Oryza sativa subsp. japonica TaxID=39947 RepID=A0A0P0VZY6_ORYSJ|nr:hypothetical protein EE612_018270 [Oryza sativa]BAS84824.1 Os03g0432200 [Oryza sativa Japonica Group]
MQPSTSAPRSPSLATPAPAVVAAVTVDVFAPWWRRRALTPPATDDATGNTAAVAGNVAAAGTARFLETLIERADCRLVNDIVFVQECPFIEKLWEEVRRRWREVVLRSQVRACQLRAYDALPAFLKHNEFIIDYYRSEWPIKQALLSALVVHNETIFQT